MIKKSSAIYGLLLSVSGFLIAALLNALIPITAPVEIVDYHIGGTVVTINIAYRIVLFFLSALFLVQGLVSLRDHDRWKKFAKGAPLRFASGIGLLLWDLLGTKWQVLPQPFFPGPAGIIEAFLIEPGFVLENTLLRFINLNAVFCSSTRPTRRCPGSTERARVPGRSACGSRRRTGNRASSRAGGACRSGRFSAAVSGWRGCG